jgi:HPt (histidine-containing phosphotransfer) domain-containing protein
MADAVYVNFAEGVKRVMNNAKFYVKMLSKFRADTKIDNLETAVASGDLEKAQAAAHTIKGLAANLSLTELFNQSLELENRIKAGSPGQEQMETVKTVFAATLREIDKILAEKRKKNSYSPRCR